MIHSFQCPNCHAPLDYKDDSPSLTVRCDYCNSTVIVPETLRQPGQGATTTAAPGSQVQSLAEIVQLVQAGNKIEAIKRFRDTFQVSLREAKDVVDAMERNEIIRLGETFSTSYGTTTVTADGTTTSVGRIVGCIVFATLMVVLLSVFVPIIAGGGLAIWGISEAERLLGSNEGPAVAAVTVASFTLPTLAPTPTATPGFAGVALQFGGEEGIGPGFFKDTRQIGVDSDGNIYTGDYSGGRVQAFDATGRFLGQWNAGSDLYMIGMAVDRQGVVYMVDRGAIQRYQGISGTALGPLAYPGSANFRKVATAPDGSVVAYAPDRLVRFDAQGNLTLDARDAFSAVPNFTAGFESLAVDGAGNIYVLGQDIVYVFDADGRYVNRFGSRGSGEDQFQGSPTALAVDGQGRVFVADFRGILVFDRNGRYQGIVDYRGAAFGMVFNDQNELLVMDRNGNQVLKYTLNK